MPGIEVHVDEPAQPLGAEGAGDDDVARDADDEPSVRAAFSPERRTVSRGCVNVVTAGRIGTGKTHLVSELGMEAVRCSPSGLYNELDA